jgi:MFS family permease
LVDRWNKHRVLVTTQVLAAIQSAGLAVLTLSGTITLHQILALSIFQGLINAFDFSARQSFVVDMIENRSDLPNAIALNSSMVNLARLVGPSFAGILIAVFGEGGCFAIDAASYLAVIATLLMMSLKPREKKSTAEKRIFLELKEGIQYVRGSKEIVSVIALLALVSFMGMPYMTLLPMIVKEQLSGNARILGYLTAASGLGALMGGLYLASRKSVLGLERVTSLAAFIFGIGLIFVGSSHSLWFSLPMMLISGMGMMVQMSSSNTILQSIVDEDKRGRVMSLFVMAYAGMMPFGGLFGGFLADRFGVAATLGCGGVACCLGAVVFFRAFPFYAKL